MHVGLLQYTVRNLVLLIASVMLIGCSRSPVVSYYTLNPEINKPAAIENWAGLTLLQVALPTLPAVVDRSEITEMGANNEVIIHENERWATDLKKIVRDFLVRDLKQLLPRMIVVSSNSKAIDRNVPSLHLSFDRFDIGYAQEAVVEMTWHIASNNRKIGLGPHTIKVAEPIDGENTGAAVAALNRALNLIAQDIGTKLLAEMTH